MRKLLIIPFVFLFGISLNGQDMTLDFVDCKFSAESIQDVNNRTAEEIYKLTIEWASYTFMNFDAISQSNVENKMFRFRGESAGVIDGPLGFRYGLGYYIQIDIKDSKIRMKVFNIYSIGTDSPPTKASLEVGFTKMFSPCKLNESKLFNRMYLSCENHLNDILKDYIEYLNNGKSKASDEW